MRAYRVTRVRGGVLRARDGRAQRCLRRRQIRLKKSQDGALESRRAAALSILARGGRGGAVGRRRAVRRHRRVHRPQPEGQVHGSRRHHRQEDVVGRQPVDHRGAVLRALCRLPQACRRHDAVRAGSLWRRRSDLPDQDPRLHRTRLALAVHPHAADPPRGVGARELRAGADHHRPAELPRRSQTSRRALGERRRDRFRPQDRPDRRVLLCRRDEEVGLHHAELLSARQGRDADALLGQCRPQGRHRDLLRPVRHRQDHAVGRSEPHADRRRRARLGQ